MVAGKAAYATCNESSENDESKTDDVRSAPHTRLLVYVHFFNQEKDI
jgi:hypothetical protein